MMWRAPTRWALTVLFVVLGASALFGTAAASPSAGSPAEAAPIVTKLSLPTNDLVYDERSRRLYAPIPSRAGELGNRIAAIDPASGAILASVFVGSEPDKLALSRDGDYLYVGLD